MYLPSHALPSSARVDGATVATGLHVLKRFWHCRCARQLTFVTPRSPPTCPIFSQAARLHFRPTLATSHVGCECPVLMRLALSQLEYRHGLLRAISSTNAEGQAVYNLKEFRRTTPGPLYHHVFGMHE